MMKPLSALHTPRNNKGFSLIEVMVALGIFSIGILAVASMQISAAQGNLSARMRTEAVTLASDQLEILNSLTYNHGDLAPGAHLDNTDNVYLLEWTVTEDSTEDFKTIEVSVTWQDRGTEQSTALNYIRANLEEY